MKRHHFLTLLIVFVLLALLLWRRNRPQAHDAGNDSAPVAVAGSKALKLKAGTNIGSDVPTGSNAVAYVQKRQSQIQETPQTGSPPVQKHPTMI
jgi:hypothetical protein